MERGFKLISTAAHITGTGFILDAERSSCTDQSAGLVHPLLIHHHRAGHDQPPGLLAALGQTTLGQEDIKALAFLSLRHDDEVPDDKEQGTGEREKEEVAGLRISQQRLERLGAERCPTFTCSRQGRQPWASQAQPTLSRSPRPNYGRNHRDGMNLKEY